MASRVEKRGVEFELPAWPGAVQIVPGLVLDQTRGQRGAEHIATDWPRANARRANRSQYVHAVTHRIRVEV